MKSIVFGGSGFLGSHVADSLTRAGHEVTIFDLTPSPYLREGQTMVTGNILDTDAVTEAINGHDNVLHFAGIADLDDASTRPGDTVKQNILGSINVMDACVAAKVKRLVFASTIYVYSEKGGFYRCSKQAVEGYLEEYSHRYGLEFTILRYGTLFGPRSDKRNSIYRYLDAALHEKKIIAGGTGDERREYIYVTDAADLTVRALGDEYANQRLILTGHQSIYFKDLMQMIQEIVSNGTEVEFNHVQNGEHYAHTPYSYAPKAGKKLTLNPYTDLGEGLIECLREIDDPIS